MLDDDNMVKISVVMAVYNGDPQEVSQAIDSILFQTYVDFEFVIVDDGSSAEIKALLKEYTKKDHRISILENPVNIGLTKSLNQGVTHAQGIYIARMDADDLSCLDRLDKQIDYLESHPECALLGGSYEEIEAGNFFKQRLPLPLTSDEIKRNIMKFNPFCHSTVIFKKCVFEEVGGYDETYRYAQDYDLWLRIVQKWKSANTREVLIRRRMGSNISVQNERIQKYYSVRAKYNAIRRRAFPLVNAVYLVGPMLSICSPRILQEIVRIARYGKKDLAA